MTSVSEQLNRQLRHPGRHALNRSAQDKLRVCGVRAGSWLTRPNRNLLRILGRETASLSSTWLNHFAGIVERKAYTPLLGRTGSVREESSAHSLCQFLLRRQRIHNRVPELLDDDERSSEFREALGHRCA